jgi:hypothetical protein
VKTALHCEGTSVAILKIVVYTLKIVLYCGESSVMCTVKVVVWCKDSTVNDSSVLRR